MYALLPRARPLPRRRILGLLTRASPAARRCNWQLDTSITSESSRAAGGQLSKAAEPLAASCHCHLERLLSGDRAAEIDNCFRGARTSKKIPPPFSPPSYGGRKTRQGMAYCAHDLGRHDAQRSGGALPPAAGRGGRESRHRAHALQEGLQVRAPGWNKAKT